MFMLNLSFNVASMFASANTDLFLRSFAKPFRSAHLNVVKWSDLHFVYAASILSKNDLFKRSEN